MYVLALATLGSVTQIGSFLFVMSPKGAKASTLVTHVSLAFSPYNFANGNTALRGKKSFVTLTTDVTVAQCRQDVPFAAYKRAQKA